MTPAPRVSVIVPTHLRPDLVVRAVRSALEQSLSDIEVIVIVDGRDDLTTGALRAVDDPRLRVHVPERHLGNAEARNLGVSLARAALVAFLDDDDTWMAGKLERQLASLPGVAATRPVVGCRFIARGASASAVWPRRLPRPGEDLSEYFFCRRTPFTGEGMVITSTILTTKAFATEVPFNRALERHVDSDWLLRVGRVPGFVLAFPPGEEPLVTWHVEHTRGRITTRRDWQASLAWCRGNRALFSARGYAAFLLHVVGSNAAAQHAWRALPMLLREAARDGRPAAVDVASHVANFVLPAGLQRAVAGWVGQLRRPVGAAPPRA